jgi:dolichol-phosphate mannosyltransferase
LEPNSYYAVTKASATYFCQYIARSKNINIPTLRLYNIYGPYEEPTRLMPTLIVKGLEGKLPPLVNPDIARDLVYMDDISEAYMLTARTQHKDPGAIYNVGSGVQTTLRTMVEIARTVLGITAEPQWGSMQDRIWDTKVWVADSEKIRTELGWKPRYSFEQGFRLMLEWFKQNPSLLEYYRKQMKTN